METSTFKNDSHSDLYTIPSYSSWFSWSNIHEIERISLCEFFDGSSITRSPRIYKEYRDFIISKYREDPSRPRLTFTELRKSLVGDVTSLHKVFTFLEKWGLINFTGNPSLPSSSSSSSEEESKWAIRVEEGAPHGVRVVGAPNSLKPVTAPPPPVEIGGGGGEVADIGTKFPPLASYSNLFEELMIQQLGKKCGSCKEGCDSCYYEYIKDQGYTLCQKCFESGSYGDEKSIDDFKLVDHKSQEVVWTQAETLLLLESVLKHGDDWELVAENVKTKTKLDCIHKLLQLPFGDFLLGSAFGKNRSSDVNGGASSLGEVQISSTEKPETAARHDDKNQDEQKEKAEELGPPQKKRRTVPASDASGSLMNQVAHLSSLVGPYVTAFATEAAVAELCYENRCTREIFDDDDDDDDCIDKTGASPLRNEQEMLADGSKGSMIPEHQESVQRNVVSLTLRMRAVSATALAAAAAHAKLLADQEEREIEHLVATVMEIQLKKLQSKAKHLECWEQMLEKQRGQIEELKEGMVAERMDVLQEVFSGKFKDLPPVKHQGDTSV